MTTLNTPELGLHAGVVVCTVASQWGSVWNLHVLLAYAWVLSGYSGFLPPSKNMHVRYIDDSKIVLRSVCGCLSHLSLCGPVMDWWPVQSVPCLLPNDHWDWLQPPCNPTNGLSGYRKWMDSIFDAPVNAGIKRLLVALFPWQNPNVLKYLWIKGILTMDRIMTVLGHSLIPITYCIHLDSFITSLHSCGMNTVADLSLFLLIFSFTH